MTYYDKEGRPISHAIAWAHKLEQPGYARVAETTLPDGIWISTVWLGIDHGFGKGPPLIFETMVFHNNDGDQDCERYSTLAEAQAGHEAMVAKWQAK